MQGVAVNWRVKRANPSQLIKVRNAWNSLLFLGKYKLAELAAGKILDLRNTLLKPGLTIIFQFISERFRAARDINPNLFSLQGWVCEDDGKICWKVFVRKLKMFSILDNSQMTTHTFPEGGHSGKWLKCEDNGSIMTEITFNPFFNGSVLIFTRPGRFWPETYASSELCKFSYVLTMDQLGG